MKERKPRLLQQRVYRGYLIREAAHFKDHKKGVPEWIKNSDDSYTRHEEFNQSNFSDLPIFVNISKDEIVCVDFGGATAKDMIKHIPYYGSPDAATQGKTISSNRVSGGHGNGGKYYALSQFKECQIISYFLGRLTVLLINKDGDYVVNEDEEVSPRTAMQYIGLDEWDYFNKNKDGKAISYKIIQGKLNLFCWKGIDPKDKKQISYKRELSKVLTSIANHPQSRSALRCRKVSAFFNGEMFWPLMKPQEAKPDESFGIREFALPNEIEQFKFNKHFKSVLKIVLSKEPLTGEKSSLNILEIDAFGKNIAYYEIPQLLMDKGLSKSLYASIDCPELREYECVSNDRVNLIDDLEITNLFLDWCKAKLREVLEELTNKEKRREETKHLQELGTFLKEITDEISDLLEEENIIKPYFKKDGQKKEIVEVPTDLPGFGAGGKIKQIGGGIRRGQKEEKEAESTEKKTKSKLNILLSNHDLDPLTPGKTFDMIERQPILYQRSEDVAHGIWWINSQKNYIKKIKIGDPGAKQFYFFLVKEIILSHRIRRRFKEQERYDPDGLEELNFQLIDEIFNKVVQRLGIDLSMDQTTAARLRDAIKTKDKFTVSELSNELQIDPVYITCFINDTSNGVLENFKVDKNVMINRRSMNLYTRK